MRVGMPQSLRASQRVRQGDKETRRQGVAIGLLISLSPPLLVSSSSFLRALCVLCSYFSLVIGGASAARQEVVPIEGAAFRADLVAIDAGGRISFGVADTKEKKSDIRTLALDEFVRWGHPV